MRVLVLGGSGMLGHKLWQELAPRFDAFTTLRREFSAYAKHGLFDPSRSKCLVSVDDIGSVEAAIEDLRPDVVVNCIGVVKKSKEAEDPVIFREVNSLFPHRVAEFCGAVQSRLIHISTDCVFKGTKGNYVEDDVADADDPYGKTKFEGEVSGDGCLTIRTSMVGRELKNSFGLIEWFFRNHGKAVPGYTSAIFSGLTTIELARLIAQIIQEHCDLAGIWHVASQPISKFDLLSLVKAAYDLNIEIKPEDLPKIDRSLNGGRFSQKTGYNTPSWQKMIEEMHQDPTPYAEIRRAYAER